MSQIKVELQDVMGNDRSISESAWTSSLDYSKKQSRTDEDVARVVKMLAEAKHSTPFESVVMRFWIKMPIAIDRQYMTHRLQSASGMSGRYRTMPSEYLEVPDELIDLEERIYKTLTRNQQDISQFDTHLDMYYSICESANTYYSGIIKRLKEHEKSGIITNNEFKRAREFYRGMLPQHNMTERVSIMNLRAWANFIKLRLKPEAQPEIQEVARQMLEQVKLKNVAPVAIEYLEKNGWNI
jgi:flavin-dependent thymidylate synthase